MHDSELYDLSDDADYAASIQHGPRIMMRSNSLRSTRSKLSTPEGAEIVYLKDNVAIHPTQYAFERISGRLKLINQGSTLFMTWIPYKGQSSNEKLSDKDKNLYTIRAVPMSDVSSIRRHTPALGWQYIIVVLSSGLAFPPLYFYSGGIREFLTTIKQQVNLVRSVEDANVFLVNDFQDPLQRTLSSLDLPRAVSIAKSASPLVSASDSPPTGDLKDAGRASFDISRHHNGMQLQKHSDPARDLSIQVLEKFSMVTRFARETTSQLFSEHGVVFSSNGRKKYNQDSNVHSQHLEYNDTEKVPDAGPIASEPLPHEKNPRNQTSECEAATNVGTFEVIYYKEFERLSLVLGKPRQPSLGTEEWATFLDSEGRVLDSLALKKRIFYGGVEHNLRREVWPFLLEYHRYDSTYVERECMVSVKKLEYESIKNQWKTISVQQSRRFAKYRERKSLIEKDVVRTDRSFSFYDGDDNPNVALLRDILLTYSFYNFDLGYCQGMSDLLSPILFVLKDESESFWCFVSLMERLGPNFNRDQSGMHNQLFALSKLVEILDSPLHDYFKQKDCLNYFFCFRWILIQFKREFAYERTMRLWEVLWTHYLSEHLHMYVCVAVLKQHRNKIMEEQMDFDTLLKFINELSGHIDLDATLRDAEALCICAGENAAACIPPGTPPALPIDDSVYPHQEDVS